MAAEEPRRTSRVRKTPSKLVQDFDIVDSSPKTQTLTTWDQEGLKRFYDAVAQHGGKALRKVSSACGRTLGACEDLYQQHQGFLERVDTSNADSMWPYFSAFTAGNMAPAKPAATPQANAPEAHGPYSTPNSKRPQKKSKSQNDTSAVPTPTRTGRRTTPRKPAADLLRSTPNAHSTPGNREEPPLRKRRLDFSEAKDSPLAMMGVYSRLDVLAAAASEAAGTPSTPPASAAPSTERLTPSQQNGQGQATNDDPDARGGQSLLTSETTADGPEVGMPEVTPSGKSRRRGNAAAAAAERAQAQTSLATSAPLQPHPLSPGLQALDRMQQGGTDADQGSLLESAAVVSAPFTAGAGGSRSQQDSQTGKTGRAHVSCRTVSQVQPPSGPSATAELSDASAPGPAVIPPPTDGPLMDRIVSAVGKRGFSAAMHADGLPGSGMVRRSGKRKSPPERLPLALMQYRGWLMHGCGGNAWHAGDRLPDVGENGTPMGAAERRLRHCLGLRTRRWAMFEFVTPAIDRPYYQAESMESMLKQLGVGEKRTRADMSFIRRALGGPPRGLTEAFLYAERCTLHANRLRCRSEYECRQHAQEPRPLPPDIPSQCHVGQHVVARHPQLRTIHDGDVLSVGVSTYMVQFHRSELGVCKVLDTDVMPAHGGPDESDDVADVTGDNPVAAGAGSGAQVDNNQQAVVEADHDLLDKVASLMATKQTLLSELKELNDEAAWLQPSLQGSEYPEDFQHKYAEKVIQVKDINQEISPACRALKTRVDELGNVKAIVTRAAPVTVTNPYSADDVVSKVAGQIVDESMAEAAALVQDLFEQHKPHVAFMSDETAGDGPESASKVAVFVDDQMLMHLSIKLAAMFIAIQRCAASGQDARTIQRALIKLVADLKPASHTNTIQYQLITKNVGRLSCYLGAR